MTWLSNKEREDEDSRRRGFSNSYEEMKARFKIERNKLVEQAKSKLSQKELEALISWIREK